MYNNGSSRNERSLFSIYDGGNGSTRQSIQPNTPGWRPIMHKLTADIMSQIYDENGNIDFMMCKKKMMELLITTVPVLVVVPVMLVV